MRDLADVFKALGDETRLMMIALLFKKPELCVCDFEGTLKISQSKASRHLQTLKHAGFLSDRRAGLWVHYRISENLDDERSAIIKLLKTMLGEARVKGLYDQLGRWLKHKCCSESEGCNSHRPAREA